MAKTPANKLASCAAYRARILADPEKAAIYRAKKKAEQERRKADPEIAAKEREYHKEYKKLHRKKLNTASRDRYRAIGPVLHLRRKGLSDSLLATVKSALKCEICGGDPDGRWKRLVIDHCHSTGKFRGMLCNNCNHGLGKFQDSPELLRQAATYLDQFRKTLTGEYVAD